MNADEVSVQLLEYLGGKDNIRSNMACMTRLRVGVKDMSKVSVDKLKSVEGVLGVVEADTIQIVFGPGKSGKILEAFSKLTGIGKSMVSDSASYVAKVNKDALKAKHNKPLQRFFKRIADIFIPLLPGIIAAYQRFFQWYVKRTMAVRVHKDDGMGDVRISLCFCRI